MEIKGIHANQGPALFELARTWDIRVSEAQRQLADAGGQTAPERAKPFEELRFAVARFAGARDELRRDVQRLPSEVGHLYDEDHERLEHVLKVLERTAREVNAQLQAAGLPGLEKVTSDK